MDALEEVRAKLADRGVVFAFARVKHDILGPLQAYGLADRVGADQLFPTLPTAEAAYRAWESERAGGRRRPPPAEPSRARGLTHRPTTKACPRAIATGSCTTHRRASRPGRLTNPPAALLQFGGRVKSSQSRAHRHNMQIRAMSTRRTTSSAHSNW
jgi:hypothetical protein